MTPKTQRALGCLACLLASCGGSASTKSDGASGDGSATDTAGGMDAGAPSDGAGADGASGARTIANCTTSIAPEAPEFFRRYFKCVTVTVSGDDVVIATSDLPPHPSNYWPASSPNHVPFDTSRGPMYKPNPNTLAEKNIKLTIPKNPSAKGISIGPADVDGKVGTSKEEYSLGPVGVAIDSVALFNPLAAPGDDIENEKYTFDAYNAHPAPDSTYHYHTVSPGPLEVLASIGAATKTTPGAAEIELYGIMCDGTVVLGCTELDGSAPAGALDAQGGHVHDLLDEKKTLQWAARYHVHVCPSASGGRRYTPEIRYYTTCTRS